MPAVILAWLSRLMGAWSGFATFRAIFLSVIGYAGYDAIRNARELFDELLQAVEWRERLASWVLEKAGIEISKDNLEDVEAWKIALGKRGALMINQSLGTSIDTIYPPDTLKEQIKRQVESDILNGGGGFIPSDLVDKIKKQIQESAMVSRGLSGIAVVPILGTDSTTTKVLKKRANNRAYQREYRAKKQRLQLWIDDDMQGAVQEFEAKIKTILQNRPRPDRPPRKLPTGSGVL